MTDALFKPVPNPAETRRGWSGKSRCIASASRAEVAEMCVYLLSDEVRPS